MRPGSASHGLLSLRFLRLKHQSRVGSFSVERGGAFCTICTFYTAKTDEGHTPHNARFAGVSEVSSIETGGCFRCWEYWSLGVRVRKGACAFTGQGKRAGCSFYHTPRLRNSTQESNRRSDAGRTLQEQAVTPRNPDIGMGDTPKLDSVLAFDGLYGVLLQCSNLGCGNCGLHSSK